MDKNIVPDGQAHYELLYLISNKFSETELDPIKDKINKLITDQGGTITLSQDWGKKRLAYAIKGFYHGYYHLLEFNLSPDKTKFVDNTIRLSSEILRHQIVKTNWKSETELAALAALKAKVAAKEVSETPAETPVATPTASTDKAEVAPKAKKAEATETNKVELSDLDNKLDQIIDTDNLL